MILADLSEVFILVVDYDLEPRYSASLRAMNKVAHAITMITPLWPGGWTREAFLQSNVHVVMYMYHRSLRLFSHRDIFALLDIRVHAMDTLGWKTKTNFCSSYTTYMYSNLWTATVSLYMYMTVLYSSQSV